MTQEEKELLLKDLCARLPYKVHCRVFKLNGDIKENDDILYGIVGDNVMTLKSDKDECLMYYQIKPYLRPMSSMTDKEKIEYDQIRYDPWHSHYDEQISFKMIDWLNKKMFDYRGLIPMGLALSAKEGMYQ